MTRVYVCNGARPFAVLRMFLILTSDLTRDSHSLKVLVGM